MDAAREMLAGRELTSCLPQIVRDKVAEPSHQQLYCFAVQNASAEWPADEEVTVPAMNREVPTDRASVHTEKG